MSNSKIVVLTLVLIAVVFAVAVGLGVNRKTGTGDRDAWIESLDGFSTKVTPDEVEAPRDFLQNNTFTLKPGGQGKAKINPSRWVRSVVLELKEGTKVQVRFEPEPPQEDGVKAVDTELSSTEKLRKFPVGKHGGTFVLAWKAGGVCKVQLGE